jgi:hypothetical protein
MAGGNGVRELLLARARARTAEGTAAAEAAKALKRLSAALERLRAAAERCAAIADFPEAHRLTSEAEHARRESLSVAGLMRVYQTQARRAETQATSLRTKAGIRPQSAKRQLSRDPRTRGATTPRRPPRG